MSAQTIGLIRNDSSSGSSSGLLQLITSLVVNHGSPLCFGWLYWAGAADLGLVPRTTGRRGLWSCAALAFLPYKIKGCSQKFLWEHLKTNQHPCICSTGLKSASSPCCKAQQQPKGEKGGKETGEIAPNPRCVLVNVSGAGRECAVLQLQPRAGKINKMQIVLAY